MQASVLADKTTVPGVSLSVPLDKTIVFMDKITVLSDKIIVPNIYSRSFKVMKYKGKQELPLVGITNFCKRWKVREFSVFGSVFLERSNI